MGIGGEPQLLSGGGGGGYDGGGIRHVCLYVHETMATHDTEYTPRPVLNAWYWYISRLGWRRWATTLWSRPLTACELDSYYY